MAQITLKLSEALFEELRSIDWNKTNFKNMSDWLRDIIRSNMPCIKNGD